MLKQREGMVQVTGGKIWYRVAGRSDAVPLITLHGGPGWPSDSLEPLQALADERPVVFYDQLGCGKSDRPDDMSLWVVERFVEELEQLRLALGYEQFHLHGHSWGTMLAVDYVLAYPQRVVRLVLSSPALSVIRWTEDAKRLVADMELADADILLRHDRGEEVDKTAFDKAYETYSLRHICRLDPRPEPMQRARDGFSTQVYNTMWGPSEITASGNLRTFERVDRLGEISQPVLLTCGRYDESTPEALAYYHQHFRDARMTVFENSAHVPQFEDTEDYIRVIREFLRG